MSEAHTPRPGAPGRSPEEIRRDIAVQQQELAASVEVLRGRVDEITDVKGHLEKHREQIIQVAAAAGGTLVVILVLKRRKRKKRAALEAS